MKKNENICKNCGKVFSGRKSTYCSMKCHHEYRRNEFVNKWLNGEIQGGEPKSPNILSDHIRHWLLDKHDNKCEECGWGKTNPVSGTIPLGVHHIDGNTLNHHLENLKVLCPNCHSLTPTYCSLNKGRGRKK